MAFEYRARDPQSLVKRATQKGGDFIGIFRDGVKIYKVRDGENAIRILPAAEDYGHYGTDIWMHSNVGAANAKVLCLFKTDNKRHFCPVCDLIAKSERAGDTETAKALKAKRRVLVWLLDVKEPDKGPQVWAMPWTVDRDICKVSEDPQTKDYYIIDHPDTGYNVYFKMEITVSKEGKFPDYTGIQIAKRPTSVPEPDLEYIQNNLLSKTLEWKTKEEIQELLDGGSDAPPDARPPRRAYQDGADRREDGHQRQEAHQADPLPPRPTAAAGGPEFDGRRLPAVEHDAKADEDSLRRDADALKQDVIGAEQTIADAATSRKAILAARFAAKNNGA